MAVGRSAMAYGPFVESRLVTMPRVIRIRRYPVKSMGGEPLSEVEIDSRGLVGDRWFAVEDDEGRLASGKNSRRFRRRDAVFEHTAVTQSDGTVRVTRGSDTWRAGAEDLDVDLSRLMGARVRVRPEDDTPHQDMGSVSLIGSASLEWCARTWGVEADPRRLRVNLVLETEVPFIEETWAGHELAIGTSLLRVTERVPRCRMIDIDQDGARGGDHWLTHLGAERDMCLAMYADVLVPGRIGLGDPGIQ